MSYEQMHDWAGVVLLLCLVAGAVHLVLGLVRPGWVGRKGRGSATLVSLGLWLVGIAVWAGTIGYTHSRPDGPHSVSGYIDSYFAEQCAKGADLPACKHKGAAGAAAQPAQPASP